MRILFKIHNIAFIDRDAMPTYNDRVIYIYIYIYIYKCIYNR